MTESLWQSARVVSTHKKPGTTPLGRRAIPCLNPCSQTIYFQKITGVGRECLAPARLLLQPSGRALRPCIPVSPVDPHHRCPRSAGAGDPAARRSSLHRPHPPPAPTDPRLGGARRSPEERGARAHRPRRRPRRSARLRRCCRRGSRRCPGPTRRTRRRRCAGSRTVRGLPPAAPELSSARPRRPRPWLRPPPARPHPRAPPSRTRRARDPRRGPRLPTSAARSTARAAPRPAGPPSWPLGPRARDAPWSSGAASCGRGGDSATDRRRRRHNRRRPRPLRLRRARPRRVPVRPPHGSRVAPPTFPGASRGPGPPPAPPTAGQWKPRVSRGRG